MISFDSLTLNNWLLQNKDFLTGARIQKIQQPTRRELVFVLRNNAETQKLYINITPQMYHLCFMSKENETKRLINIPQKPPMFCMLLRKYLENSRIAKVNQPDYERILEFYIEAYDELSEKIYLCLAIELMGKHSNIVLYNYDNNLIIGCAHNVGAEKSREREMAGGLPYVYPPKHANSWYVNDNSLSKLSGNLNENIDNYYAQCIEIEKFGQMQNNYISLISKKQKKNKTSLLKMQKQVKSDEKADKYRLYGDLIMANLYNLRDFSKYIEVYDYENNKNVTIELDETKTLKDNANRFYKLYNKAKTSNIKLSELISNYNAERLYLEQLLYSVESAQNISDLEELASEIEPDKLYIKPEKSSLMPQKTEIEGCEVFVGKNNRQNDYIVSKLAKAEDWWFHTRDCAGSHVLLKCENPSDLIIFECAKLAKKHSAGSLSSKVGVIYTKAKNLKKPPKANLGYVIYKNEKEIIID